MWSPSEWSAKATTATLPSDGCHCIFKITWTCRGSQTADAYVILPLFSASIVPQPQEKSRTTWHILSHFTLTIYQKSHIINAKAAAGDRRFALMYGLRNKPHSWSWAVYFFFVRSLTSSMTSTIRESKAITSVKDSLFIVPPPFRGRKAPSWDKRDEPPTVYSFGCLRGYYCTCR